MTCAQQEGSASAQHLRIISEDGEYYDDDHAYEDDGDYMFDVCEGCLVGP